MSDKDAEQIALELENLEIPGNQNPWERKDTRYTNTILNEAAGTEFSSQALSNIVRRDQNRLEGIQNRNAMVIAVDAEVSDYEKIKFNMNGEKSNPGDTNIIKKVYTRNAESKNYFITPPWKYDNSNAGLYKQFISTELHTSTIQSTTVAEEIPTPGDFMEILYEDQTQNTAKFLRPKKKGLQAFPSLISSKQPFVAQDMWPGNDNDIISKPGTPKEDGPSKLPSPKDWEGKPQNDSIVEQLKALPWSPIYAPIAVPPNISIKITSRFGPRKLARENNKQRWHKGIDLNTTAGNKGAGDPIVAIAPGVVTIVGFDQKINKPGQPTRSDKIGYVVVKHDIPNDKKGVYEVSTRSMHLFLIADKPGGGRLENGDRVEAGQVLGYMGGIGTWPGAGSPGGIHLHFEVLVSKMEDGIKKYDSYTLAGDQGRSEDKVTFAGESKYKTAKGAVNPLFFNYPNLATYPESQREKIQQQTPKAPPTPAEETAAAEAVATDAAEEKRRAEAQADADRRTGSRMDR